MAKRDILSRFVRSIRKLIPKHAKKASKVSKKSKRRGSRKSRRHTRRRVIRPRKISRRRSLTGRVKKRKGRKGYRIRSPATGSILGTSPYAPVMTSPAKVKSSSRKSIIPMIRSWISGHRSPPAVYSRPPSRY